MNSIKAIAFAAATAAMTSTSALAAEDRLKVLYSTDHVINGVTGTPDGRLFLPVQQQQAGVGPQLIEVKDGKAIPYPDESWNDLQDGQDAAGGFVGVNAARIGPDGALWVVDRGAPGIGKPRVDKGPKLVRIDVDTNSVSRVFSLQTTTSPWSFVDDVRFNGRHAYLTDAGDPGLIVLDLETGKSWRALHGHPSTIAQTPLMAEGKAVRDPAGKAVNLHADHLEVSPDGRWFYYQPANGQLAHIETRLLDDPDVSEAKRADAVTAFAATPSTGGTAMSADGTIYLSDTDRSAILSISPGGEIDTVIADPRLAWVDAMWIDEQGRLLLPASQLSRTAGLNSGENAIKPPIRLYALDINAKPLRR